MRHSTRILLAAAVGFALSLAAARPASATDFFVYAATFKLVVEMTPRPPGTVVITRKLGNNDIINLALGRPLTTKVDKKTEILAGAGTFANHATESTLIVFDPSQNGVNQIKAVVGTVTAIDFSNAYLAAKSTGTGFGSATFNATTLGNPGQNGFLVSNVQGGGEGSGTHVLFEPGTSKVSGKGNLQGRLRFNFTDAGGTQLFDGYIRKGQAKASGKPLGGFVQ